MKTISMAAKEGIEAAGKVKELETDNKKLGEENIVLTKNFESERVSVYFMLACVILRSCMDEGTEHFFHLMYILHYIIFEPFVLFFITKDAVSINTQF